MTNFVYLDWNNFYNESKFIRGYKFYVFGLCLRRIKWLEIPLFSTIRKCFSYNYQKLTGSILILLHTILLNIGKSSLNNVEMCLVKGQVRQVQ